MNSLTAPAHVLRPPSQRWRLEGVLGRRGAVSEAEGGKIGNLDTGPADDASMLGPLRHGGIEASPAGTLQLRRGPESENMESQRILLSGPSHQSTQGLG